MENSYISHSGTKTESIHVPSKTLSEALLPMFYMQYKEKIAHNKKQNVPQSWSLRDHLSLECRHVYLLVESLFCGVGVIQHMVFIDFELFWWCIWCLFDVFLDLVQHEFFYWKLWQTLTYIYTNSCQQIWMNQSNIYHIVDKQE